jgi:hypothetical protein
MNVKTTLPTITTRAVALSRLLSALLVALVLGTMLISDADAAKNTGKKPKSIAERVKIQEDNCGAMGGTFTSRKTAFGSTITTCDAHGEETTCVNTKKSTKCHTMTAPPESGPAISPSDGVYEEPPAEPAGGGGKGGGTTTNPPGVVQQSESPDCHPG